jgi:hypothetical protein
LLRVINTQFDLLLKEKLSRQGLKSESSDLRVKKSSAPKGEPVTAARSGALDLADALGSSKMGQQKCRLNPRPAAVDKETGKTDPDKEINQHKADSTRNNFSIATQQVLQPDYEGHLPPLPLLIGTKT